MAGEIRHVSARALKALLNDGGEIALLDGREEGIFHGRHLLLASCVPLGRLELLIDDLVPRRGTRVVWCDDGDGSALRAARRMSQFGYDDVAVLEGGIAAWEAAGYRLYSGVHVRSKAFAEVVEHEAETPWISAPDLKGLIDSGANIAIFDSRSYEEYHNNSIPTAISVPGAELVYRFTDLVPSPDTTVIVNCGGRTRSIIGAQALRNAGFRNKIMSLKDGTMAWHLAGFEVVHGATRRPPEVSEAGRRAAIDAAARIAKRTGIPRIDKQMLAGWRAEADRRTLYVLDVRTPEEYLAGHLAGARSVPGGQLVQETDAHIATWNARVVLVDDNGVRATMTASWLKQMGWNDVSVLVADASAGDWESARACRAYSGSPVPPFGASNPPHCRLGSPPVTPPSSIWRRAGAMPRVTSRVLGSRSVSRLAEDLGKLPKPRTFVLTSPDGALARLAAAELAGSANTEFMVLAGGTEAWIAAGLPVETGAAHMASPPEDVVLSARERGQGREEAMREYLAWEIDLVNQMATDDDQRFRVVTG